MSTQPLARSLAESSPAPGARKRARTSSVVPSDAQRLAMLKVSDYDAWLGECKAKWRVLRKKLAVVRDFVKHEAGAASARDDGGDRSGALAGAPGGGLRGALAGLRAKPRKHEGLTRWKSVKPEDVRLGDGEKLQRALVALAKLASTADGPRLRRPGDANVSLLADAEALDEGPARGGAEGAAADASALATRAFQPFEAEDMADTEEDEDDEERDEGDEDEDEEGEEEEEMDEDEDAVDAGFVAAEDASPETAPTSRRAPLALPEPSAPGADVLESADDALAAYSAGPPLPRVPERPSPSPAEAAAAAEAMPPPPPVGIRPAPTPVPELSASAVAALDAYGMSEDVDGAETARITSAEASEAAVLEADPGFGGGVGVGPPSVPRVPPQNAQPLEDPWVTCRPVVPAPDAPPATDAGETRRNRDDPDSIGLARLARLASPREFVSRSARSALDDREKELAKALRLCEKPWMELTVAETGLILAQIKYLITRRRRKHAGGSHARVRRAGDQEDENERVDGDEDEDEGGDDEAPGGPRSFACVACGRAFSQRSHLMDHVNEHTGAKPYECDVPGCGAAFSSRAALSRHLAKHDAPCACDYPGCLRAFATPNALAAHRRTHEEARPFACEVPGCTKRFKNEDSLRQHGRVHTGERRFACEYPGCGRRFGYKVDLKRHERTHRGEKARG